MPILLANTSSADSAKLIRAGAGCWDGGLLLAEDAGGCAENSGNWAGGMAPSRNAPLVAGDLLLERERDLDRDMERLWDRDREDFGDVSCPASNDGGGANRFSVRTAKQVAAVQINRMREMRQQGASKLSAFRRALMTRYRPRRKTNGSLLASSISSLLSISSILDSSARRASSSFAA
jgi:hypothetical protein